MPPACIRLVVDGAVAACTSSSADFLRASPRGAYTTAHTLRAGAAVFDLTAHIARLAASAVELGGEGQGDGTNTLPPAPPDIADVETLAHRVRASLALALAPDVTAAWPGREFKVTMLATWGGGRPASSSSSVAVHTALLPPPPPPPVIAVVAGSPRSHAAAKDSAWVLGRGSLDAARSAMGADEALLSTPEGRITEGTSSNFAVLDATGTLVTAPEGAVLAGTVRGALLAAAAATGTRVLLEAPRLGDAASWAGALLLSTSRLALPVDELIVKEDGGEGGGGSKHDDNDDTVSVPLPGVWRRVRLPSRADARVTALVAAVAAEVERRGEAV